MKFEDYDGIESKHIFDVYTSNVKPGTSFPVNPGTIKKYLGRVEGREADEYGWRPKVDDVVVITERDNSYGYRNYDDGAFAVPLGRYQVIRAAVSDAENLYWEPGRWKCISLDE